MTDEDPTASSIVEEVERGRSWRTPFLAIGGVAIVLGGLFVLALVIVVLAYALA